MKNNTLTLSNEDGQLFYELWKPLLDFVNKKYRVTNKLQNIAEGRGLDPTEVMKIADKLWSNVEVIDEYVQDNTNLPEEHQEIIRSWKRRIRGRFIMERHLKQGSIFISENGEVYQVKGITSSWDDMYFGWPMPVMVDATFIPFRNVIIPDGLMSSYNIIFGSGMKKSFKEEYMDAKKNNRIIKSL